MTGVDGGAAPAGAATCALPGSTTTPDGAIILSTGPSGPNSGHALDEFGRCPQLHGWRLAGHLGDPNGPPDPYEKRRALVLGTLGHLGTAQHYKRLQEAQAGRDVRRYAAPEAAIEAVAKARGPAWECEIELAIEGVASYIRYYSDERLTVLGVERVFDLGRVPAGTPLLPFPHTRAVDLVIAWGAGVSFLERKWVGRITDRTIRRYQIDGQLLDYCLLLEALKGPRVGGGSGANQGVWLDLAEWDEVAAGVSGRGSRGGRVKKVHWRFQRVEVTPRRGLLAGRLAQLKQRHAAKQRLLASGIPPTRWAEHGYGRLSEASGCNGPYDLCPAYDLCWNGP